MWCIPILQFTGEMMKFGIAGAQFSGKSAYCGIIVSLLVVYIQVVDPSIR